MENLTNQEFMSIIFLGLLLGMLCDIFISIINAINEKAWLVKDYEKIISKYLNTYVAEDNKEKKLIFNAKENTDKRFKRKQKLDKLFNKKYRRS